MSLKIASVAATVVVTAFTAAASTAAQTDFYNTDARRPVRIEDAYPLERYGFELQLAPLRIERHDGGTYAWELEPELAYGILPRTHLEIGVPLRTLDVAGERDFGVAGVEIGALHNLNVETRTLPALALTAGVLLPVGSFAPERAYASVGAIVTRSLFSTRLHLNGQYTIGSEQEATEAGGEVSRWLAGVAVDRAFPLRSLLLIADAFVEQPLHEEEDLAWTVEVGVRYQLDPWFSMDAGIGRRTTGPERGWFLTVGVARAFAIRSLIPVPRR